LLKVDNIDVFYNELQVLWKVSLEAKMGELTAILGANGAGKSTLLKTIVGLLHPKSGSIEFLGERIDQIPAHNVIEKGIAMVPEERWLFPRMTVRENLELGAYKAREKVKDSLEWVYQIFPRLKEREKQLAGTLSGGEQQMLAMGRGLMSRPKLYLLDEPSLGLAPIVVDEVFSIINQLKEEGITIILVEQNLTRSLKMADKAYVLETGHIILSGSGKDLIGDERVKKAFLGM
jgi:branched-chain amino acid transport system ATP-binding protein